MAEEELAKMVARISLGEVATGNETLGHLLDLFIAHCESIERSPTTVKKYRQIANNVVRPRLGKVRLRKLTARHLDQLYDELRRKGNKGSTRRRVHALVSAALAQAVRWEMVDSNVALKAHAPTTERVEVKGPTPEEVQAIIEVADAEEPMMATLLLMAALTGVRRGELLALRWSDLDADAGVLTIRKSIYETEGGGWAEKPTKTHQVRRVGLDELALEALRRHRDSVDVLAAQLQLVVPDDAYMFSRSLQGLEPLMPNLMTKATIRFARKAGTSDVHLHSLRHFSATQGIARGFDVRTVASRLGHADPSITLRVYSHAIEQRDRELAASLGSVLALPRSAGSNHA